ncbi:ATP-binding protein [Lactobacillus crispatus]|nr:ATP-binding protein [Lactobacillus crispatus]WAZ53314.1 ATP-binding protein [Lactobacillus crispatus]
MRETKNLEFKENLTNTFLKTVSAYANYGTGEVKFGIKDDGTIIGVKNPIDFCLNCQIKCNS